MVAFVRDARETPARVRIGERGRARERPSFVARIGRSSFSGLVSRRVFTARVSPRRDVDEMASARGADVEEGKTTPTPPVDWRARNPLKQLFFAQVSPLIAEGTVRRLEPTDLCHLDALDSQRVRVR